jgi:hypothetical protein
MPPPRWNLGGGIRCSGRFVRSRQWRDLRRSHAFLVAVAAVVPAAITIDVAGGSLLTTAAVTLVVASLLQPIAGDVFEFRATAEALALPSPVAAPLAALASFRPNVHRRRATSAHEATETSRRHRLNQPSPPGAGGGLLDKRIECLAIHAVSPFSVHRHQVITQPGRRHTTVGASRPILTCDYTGHLLLDHVFWQCVWTAPLRHPLRAREPCRRSRLRFPSHLPVGSIRSKEPHL